MFEIILVCGLVLEWNIDLNVQCCVQKEKKNINLNVQINTLDIHPSLSLSRLIVLFFLIFFFFV